MRRAKPLDIEQVFRVIAVVMVRLTVRSAANHAWLSHQLSAADCLIDRYRCPASTVFAIPLRVLVAILTHSNLFRLGIVRFSCISFAATLSCTRQIVGIAVPDAVLFGAPQGVAHLAIR